MSLQKVLIVDDDAAIRKILEVTLRVVGGFTVLVAASGAEGLTLAETERPDLILLDVMMPEMDGPETLARLREGEATRDIPVVFLTAKVRSMDVKGYESLGAVGMLAKPFDPMTLADDVRRILDSAGGG